MKAYQEITGEEGKTTIWAMLISLVMIVGYIFVGQDFLLEHASPTLHALAVIIVAVVTIFSLGCGLHMALVGDRSDREIRRDIKNRVLELSDFVDFSRERITQFEGQAKFHMHAIRPIGLECLAQARRITNAIAERIAETNTLIHSSKTVDLIEADELMGKELILNSNSVNALIGTAPIPPIPKEEWIPTVSRLLDKVDIEIEKVTKKVAA
jgi:hypothetical protein